ncbi:hypothetical protein EVAR_9939_1 [Eumeta japonica]|uniref:Uncharacterized protein n=1 Tax=Eumeta variegata TaxID=151549 RepID=A0A4C1TR03_EUMVA|nr:hypothetical protein EVAR_9939_1 [Eumeta japonica]
MLVELARTLHLYAGASEVPVRARAANEPKYALSGAHSRQRPCYARLSSENPLAIGTSIFSRGQAYVALSKVKTLDGVHLINLDSGQIKAQDSSRIEYNHLRSLYRPDLANLSIKWKRIKKVADNEWALRTIISNIQENVDNSIKRKTMHRKRKKNIKSQYLPSFLYKK